VKRVRIPAARLVSLAIAGLRPPCVVCVKRRATGSGLCDQCMRSLASYEGDDGSVAAVIRWAAERARHFSRKRKPSA
jgi:hypothetical protein